MSRSLIVLFLCVTISCTTPPPAPAPLTLDLSTLDKSCQAGEGTSCAKLGYAYKNQGNVDKSANYYQKGCDLKDEGSCFNLNNSSPKDLYKRKLDALMKFHTDNLSNCHNPGMGNKTSRTQLEKKWHKANIYFEVLPGGTADKISVKSDLKEDFNNCVILKLSQMAFPKPGPNSDPRYNVELTLISQE